MHRLTYKEPDGRFGVKGMDWSDIPRVFYGLICKLKDYEDTGLSPEEVEKLKDENERFRKGEKVQ